VYRLKKLVTVLLLGWALAQASFEQLAALLSFGPYESVRQQANTACVQAEDKNSLSMCLSQMVVNLCMWERDPTASVWCISAASTPYPLRKAERSLPLRPYRVEIVGGYERERDPQTNRVLREKPIPPSTFYTATPQGNRFLVEQRSGSSLYRFFMDPYGVIYSPQGTPLMDGITPLFLGKPYLVFLYPPLQQGFPPSAVIYERGSLEDDFDEDGVVELGYFAIGGPAGEKFTSGTAQAIGYDPKTLALKFKYSFLTYESKENPHLNFIREELVRYRVR